MATNKITPEQFKKLVKQIIEEEQAKRTIKDLVIFLNDKNFINPRSKMFFYHGTSSEPNKFNLRSDYNWEDSNTWSGDLPEGYLFLTTSLEEAAAYGQYVIPCEFKKYNNISFAVNSDNPSREFDKDYGIDLYAPEKYRNFWGRFMDSGKSLLIIKGLNKKWTVITNIDNIIPRIDLATQFYDA